MSAAAPSCRLRECGNSYLPRTVARTQSSISEGCRTGGARMTAVVTLRPGERGRHYRLPTDADYAAVHLAQEHIACILDEWERGGRRDLCPVPDEPTPAGGGSGAGRAFSVQRYGMLQWGDVFTASVRPQLWSN